MSQSKFLFPSSSLDSSRGAAFWTFEDVVKIHPDGTVVYRRKVKGTFSQPFDLREFPFDAQSFTVHFVATDRMEKGLDFVQDPEIQSGIASKLSLADWKVTATLIFGRAPGPVATSWQP